MQRSERYPTNTPTTPAEVVVREARELKFGDRLHYKRSPRAYVEYHSVIDVVTHDDHGNYVTIEAMDWNGYMLYRPVSYALVRYVVLTAGVCTAVNEHKGYNMCCTPAPFRLDDRPWPGESTICPEHRRQMKVAYDALFPTPVA